MKKRPMIHLITIAVFMIGFFVISSSACAKDAESVEEAGKQVRAHMVDRETSFDVTVTQSSGINAESIDQIMDVAYEHTGVGYEGDYLYFQVGGKEIHFSDDGTTKTFHFDVCYSTSAAQEQAVTQAVNSFKSKYDFSGMSEYEKILAVYEYVIDTVVYDYDRMDNAVPYTTVADYVPEKYIQHTAYAAAIEHTAVCEGYGLWFYRLALEMGIDNRFVDGSVVTWNPTPELHGWNMVKLDGKYYYVDATWDTGRWRSNWNYFLKSPSNMTAFIPSERSEEMIASYTMADTSYSIPEPKIYTSGLYSYVRSYGAVIVNIKSPENGNLSIPSTLGGYPVVSIDTSMSSESTYVSNAKTVTFPEGLSRMKGYVDFRDAEEVTFPSTFIRNEKDVFRGGFDKLKTVKVAAGSPFLKVVDNVLFGKDGKTLYKCPPASGRTSYIVPEGTKRIKDCAFKGCTTLTSVTLPDGLLYIEGWAFDFCSKLASINIPNSVKEIDQWAFGYTSLSGTITLPVGIEYFAGAFTGSPISAFAMEDGNKAGYSVINGVICYDYKNEGYKQVLTAPMYMKNPTFTVPEDYLYICDNAFLETNLARISMNEGIVSIGSCAFERCKNLSSVIVPSTVKHMNDRAFGFNEKLPSVTILSMDATYWGEVFHNTNTTVYGYKGSTTEAYCKSRSNLTFKEITGPVYNWGANGERCTVTVLNDSGKPESFACTVSETGTNQYTATYGSYQNTATIVPVTDESFPKDQTTGGGDSTIGGNTGGGDTTISGSKGTIKLSVKKKTIKRKKSFTLTVKDIKKGDTVKSVKSSKKKVVTIKKLKSGKYKITGKKKGKTTITVTLKSGAKATCTVTVK